MTPACWHHPANRHPPVKVPTGGGRSAPWEVPETSPAPLRDARGCDLAPLESALPEPLDPHRSCSPRALQQRQGPARGAGPAQRGRPLLAVPLVHDAPGLEALGQHFPTLSGLSGVKRRSSRPLQHQWLGAVPGGSSRSSRRRCPAGGDTAPPALTSSTRMSTRSKGMSSTLGSGIPMLRAPVGTAGCPAQAAGGASPAPSPGQGCSQAG